MRRVSQINSRWPQDRPLISVVVPCFNYGAYIESAIDSVLNQTWKDLEILVVDGGSDDEVTIAKLRTLDKPKTTIHYRSERHLAGDNRNFGIRRARGKYICCLDADDMLAPTYLEKAVFLAEAYAYDVVFPSVRCFGDKDEIWLLTDPEFESCRARNCISTVGLFSREAWEAVGGYRDWGLGANHVPEDWDFWLRLLGNGYRAKSIREPLMHYRVHGRGLTATATMDAKSQAAKIEQANRRLNTLRRRQPVLFKKKAHFVVRNPTVNLCRVVDRTPRSLIAMPLLDEKSAHELIERFRAPRGEVTVVTTADPPDSVDELPATASNGTEVFRLPRFLDDPERRNAFLFYLLESRDIERLIVRDSDEVRRVLPEITRRFPRVQITQ
jgi:glycosyltransferase involved in cell wall biosynthesis